jgi:DNA transformation protein
MPARSRRRTVRQPFDPEQLPARARDSTREWLEEALSSLPDLSVRRMFGGAGLYADDTMFGILYAGRVYLKTSDQTRSAYVEQGSAAFRTRQGKLLKSYYELPVGVLDDVDALLGWARQALEAARLSPQSSRARSYVDPAQILEGYSAKIRNLAERARQVVLKHAPDAVELGYAGWRLIGYRCPHYFCFVAPQPDHVRVGFEHGHRLPDPDHVLEPMGKQVRFVRLVPGQPLPRAVLGRLIQAARDLRPASVRPRRSTSSAKSRESRASTRPRGSARRP